MEPSEHPAGPDPAATPVKVDAAVLLLVAGVTAAKHPLVYVRLLIQVGHEPLPPTVGTMFGRRVLYLPGFFSYEKNKRQTMAESPANQDVFESQEESPLIWRTPVSIIKVVEEEKEPPEAPKKQIKYLCRFQAPPKGELQREWFFDEAGRTGYFGYVFMYELGELWMYQRDGVNPSGCLLMAAAFTSNDWSVLRLMMLDRKDSDTDEEDNSPPSPKQSKMEDERSSAEPMEPPKSGTTFSALWQTKSSSNDHWFFRVSVHRPKEDEAFFRLESFNSSCGVYRTMFEVPFNFWQEKILEVEAEITELFHSCRDWSDKMVVKKALQF